MVLSFSEREIQGRNTYRVCVWKLFDQAKFKVVSRHLSKSVDLMVGYLAQGGNEGWSDRFGS